MRSKKLVQVALASALALALFPSYVSAASHETTAGSPGSSTASAAQLLRKLPVTRVNFVPGYDRSLFGPEWFDSDGNGCDTRNDVLARDLSSVRVSSYDTCIVVSGVLKDPYTGKKISFTRGAQTSWAVQVDHVVSLSDAWRNGAARWDPATRVQFANDPLNLLAVDGPTNMRKGDSNAAEWLPPQTSARCPYIARQVAVKAKYALSVTVAEATSMLRVLSRCPRQGIPVG